MNSRMARTMGRRQGFTLIELLMVIVVIGILVAILFPALNAVRQKAKVRHREIGREMIVSALQSYHAHTRRWPIPGAGNKAYSSDNYLVVDMLTDAGLEFKFINVSNYRQSGSGSLQDPFGGYYTISFVGPDVTVSDATGKETIVGRL